MKTLLILRHAKSSWNFTELSDHARPLNKRGKKAAPRMGQLLYAEDLVPDLILSSTARRARDTAEIVAEASGFAGEILFLDDLYHGWPSDYLLALRGVPAEHHTVMVVGHNPGVAALLEELTGDDEHFPTAAVACIKLAIEDWQQISAETEGELVGFWFPRQLMD